MISWLTSRAWPMWCVENKLQFTAKEMISQLLPFHFYVAQLYWRFHIRYVSYFWYDILELAFSIMISLNKSRCLKVTIKPRIRSGHVEIISPQFYRRHHELVTHYENICFRWRQIRVNCSKHNSVLFSSNVTYRIRFVTWLC